MGALAGRARSIFMLSSAHPWFPRYRKMLHAGLSRRAAQAEAWRPAQELQLGVLIRGLAEKPEAFVRLIKTCVCLSYPSYPILVRDTRRRRAYAMNAQVRRVYGAQGEFNARRASALNSILNT
jgi:hypothetical protein